MLTPAGLIEALRRRLHRSIRPLPMSEGLPPSWKAWFDATAERGGPVDIARVQALDAALAGLVPPVRPAARHLSGWQAFRAAWRPQWEPNSPDERGMRVLAQALSILFHLFLLVVLAWLMHTRFLIAPSPADARRGEHVIEVEFIGLGTPEEEGGDAVPVPIVGEEVEDVEQVAPPVVQPPPAETVPRPEPEPPAEPASVEQPLTVTETPLPDGPFQVPPPQPLDLPSTPPREWELTPQARDIELVETPELVAPAVPAMELETRTPDQPQLEVAEREVVIPTQPVPMPGIDAPTIQVPEPTSGASQQARVREIPMPAARQPSEAPETAAADAGPGAGTAPAPGEGAWQTPQQGDDWGASTRERTGGQEGSSSLFNPDGTARLPSGEGRVGGGLPPGTITEDHETLDRHGTWLKRPPTDYEPTRFERFWVPHEDLLEEWVRRSVRTVMIPIPGTGKSIRCNVITLAMAGGCDLVDPNLQDDPAGARPPPDVPFRPELHEDQEGLSDDAWQ